MVTMINLTQEQISLVKDIIYRYLPNCKISVFGSRATGIAKKFSDLDLVIRSYEAISPIIMFKIKEDLAESDLPFRVDVMDWQSISDEFLNAIQSKLIEISI